MPECEIGKNNREIPFNQSWLLSAIPATSNDNIENCVRYTPIMEQNSNTSTDKQTHQCSENLFNTSQTTECSEFIYASDERNIQTEVKK